MTARLAPRVISLFACAALFAPVSRSGVRRVVADRWLLVSDEPGDRLVVLNVASGEIVGTIPVGGRPRGMAPSTDGRRVFVALGKDDAVAVVAVGSRPRFVAFTRDGARAYVSAENGGTVTYVDARADTVAGAVVVGDRTTKPTGLALSPDEKTLYLANGRSNDVAVIDVASRSVVATIAVGERPWGIALSGDGRTLYTANGRSGSVSIIDVTSRRVTATIAVGGRPYSVLLVP